MGQGEGTEHVNNPVTATRDIIADAAWVHDAQPPSPIGVVRDISVLHLLERQMGSGKDRKERKERAYLRKVSRRIQANVGVCNVKLVSPEIQETQ